jgi:hypothetical protein
MTRHSVLLLCLLAATAANASSVTLTFIPPRDEEATIELRQLTRVADYEKPPTITRRLRASGQVSLEMPEGHWALSVVSPSLWHRTQTFSVFSAPETLEVPLRSASLVTGSLQTTDKADLPASVRLTFDENDGAATCPVTNGKFECRVPAGTVDLRLRSAGYVTRFFWRKTVSPEAALDLGVVTLVRGATLIGRVEVERGSVVREPIQVRAKGVAESLAATVERDGIFHIDGIAPGKYDVRGISGAQLKSQIVSVEVKALANAEIREPLRLQRPKTLRVLVVPPFDPHNHAWRVEFDRRLNNASIGGEWTATQLQAGKYELRVLASDQNIWHQESVEVADADLTLNILITPTIVHGLVARGGRKVAAHVELSDDRSEIAFDSDEEGRFTGAVPLATAEWSVKVSADAPPISYKLEHVRPSHREDSNDVDLAIALPNTAISGTVVDEAGAPQSAIVNISGDSGFQQVRTADDGSFFLSALPAGKYGVQASVFLKESDPQDVDLSDGSVTDGVKLVVKDVEKIHGRVISDFGPVPGATVVITPTNVPARMTPVNVTDEEGEFSTYVPHGTGEVNLFVAAPGYALKFFHSPMHRGLLTIPVGQSGGAMRVPKHGGSTTPYLFHIGAIESVTGMLWTSAVRDEGETYLLPAIDAGAYSLCYLSNEEASVARASMTLPPGHCQSAFLAPFGTLSFAP